MTTKSRSSSAYNKAVELLTRREHSALELHHKLSRRDFDGQEISAALEKLTAEGWLDDQRFADVYASSRADKGYGPLRIQSELRERGVSDAIISTVMAALGDLWLKNLARLRHKRFGPDPVKKLENAAKAKQIRFLRQRGFSFDQINSSMRQTDDD